MHPLIFDPSRRRWLATTCRHAAGACALSGLARVALAQSAADYPDKPVRIIVPFSPGGLLDDIGRIVAAGLTRHVEKTFIVENRPGASGNIGMVALARAPADGYTLGVVAANNLATNPALFKSVPYDATRDYAPVAFLVKAPFVLVVHPQVEGLTLPQLAAAAKARDGGFSYGSSGFGNTAHLLGELLKKRIGAPMVHVPYKSSGDALNDLLAGRLQLMFLAPTVALPHIRRGALRPVAIALDQRIPGLQDVPTFKELGLSGFENPTWLGIAAPAGTPREVVTFLNARVRAVMADPAIASQMAQAGLIAVDMTPTEFADFIREEAADAVALIKEAGVTAQ